MTKEEQRAHLRGKLLLFGKICLPQMFSYRSPEFHQEIAEAFLDYSIRKQCYIAPRGHAKSSLVAGVGVLYHILFDPGPKVIVLVSKTEGHAIRLLQTIKDALNYSLTLRYLFGYWGQFSAQKWAEREVILKDGTFIVCRGTGQQVVGLKYINQRPTLIVLDDPEDTENTATPERMEKNLKWLLTALLPSMDANRGRIIVIGTPQDSRCIVETLYGMEGWYCKRYQALKDYVLSDTTLFKELLSGETPPHPDMVLWHETWNAKRLCEELESLDSIGKRSFFFREYQCTIIGDDEQLFNPKDFRYWDGHIQHNAIHEATLIITSKDGVPVNETMPVNIFMGVDPASSTRETADFSTIMVIAVDSKGNRYIVDYYRKRVSPLEHAEAIIDLYLAYFPQKTRIETTGYQEMLRLYLREVCEKRSLYIPGLEIKEKPRDRKSKRIEGMQPFFRNKQVFLKSTQKALVEELVGYPRGRHDDLLDSLYYAFKGNYKPYHEADSPENRQKSMGKYVWEEDNAYDPEDWLLW